MPTPENKKPFKLTSPPMPKTWNGRLGPARKQNSDMALIRARNCPLFYDDLLDAMVHKFIDYPCNRDKFLEHYQKHGQLQDLFCTLLHELMTAKIRVNSLEIKS
jgi:hypothetical protein